MTLISEINSPEWAISVQGFGEIVEGISDIDQSIQVIISTAKYSDPLRPLFGSDVWRYLDKPINDALPNIVQEVLKSIETWEKRVRITSVERTISDASSIEFAVKYVRAGTSTQQTARISIDLAPQAKTQPDRVQSAIPDIAYSSRMVIIQGYEGPLFTTNNGDDADGFRLDFLYNQSGGPAMERPSNVDEGDEFVSVSGGVMTAGAQAPTDMRGDIPTSGPLSAFSIGMRINPANLAGSQSRPFGFSEGPADNFGLRRAFTTLTASPTGGYTVGLVHATQGNIVTQTATVVIPALEWAVVFFVWDGTEMRCYVNGTLKSSAKTSIFAGITANSARVGAPIGAPHNPYQSTDYLMYYGALSKAQILHLTNKLLP